MRKRNHVEAMPGTLNAKFAADHFFQLRTIDELRDSQPTDGNNEARPQNFDFIIHPGRAVANFVRSRNAIRAARIFSGKTATDRCEINFRSDCSFVHPAEFFEPAKKCLASGMRKRSLQNRFPRTGRLPNDHYVAHDCAARDRRGFHARATTALQQCEPRVIELSLNSFCSHGLWAVRTWPNKAQDQTGYGLVATVLGITEAIKTSSYRRKIDNSRLSRMLRTMQVTIGK